MPASSTSRIWARRPWSGPTTRRPRAALEALVPADILEPQARPAALHAAPRRGRRHPRRPDGDAARRTRRRTGALLLVVNASTQGGRLRPYRRAPAGRRRACARVDDRALLALQGPQAAERARPARAGRRRRSPSCRPARSMIAGIPAHVSRSGYTGEDGFEISVAGRATPPRSGELLLADPAGEADRPRRARFAAARGGPLPLRPRHRHDDLAGRGRADLVDPEAPARGGRLSGRRAHPARARGGRAARCASACSPEGRAPAREGTRDHDAGRPRGRRSSPPAASGRRVNGPVAMGYVARGRRRARHRASSRSCAASRCRPRSRRCPSRRTATSADRVRTA